MNKLEDALKDIQNFLKVRGVPYMIIGGIGNLVWGEPRMTVDIEGILLRRGALLDKKYLINWLSQFASALDKPGIQKRFEGLWKEIVEDEGGL